MVGLSDFFRKQCCIFLFYNIGFIGRSKASESAQRDLMMQRKAAAFSTDFELQYKGQGSALYCLVVMHV